MTILEMVKIFFAKTFAKWLVEKSKYGSLKIKEFYVFNDPALPEKTGRYGWYGWIKIEQNVNSIYWNDNRFRIEETAFSKGTDVYTHWLDEELGKKYEFDDNISEEVKNLLLDYLNKFDDENSANPDLEIEEEILNTLDL